MGIFGIVEENRIYKHTSLVDLNNHTGKHTAVGRKEQVVMLLTKNEAGKPVGTSLVTTMTVRTSRQLPRARFIQYVLTVLFGRNAKPDGRTDHPAGQWSGLC